MIKRSLHLQSLTRLLKHHRIVALIGGRQVGKTTLARELAPSFQGATAFFDLEDDRDLARLADPILALKDLEGLVILDEVQRVPDLFRSLRVLSDRDPLPARFLILGSASPDLLRQSSETLAGRIYYYELPGLSVAEVGPKKAKELWLRGGYPLSFLAPNLQASMEWRSSFVKTVLCRDVPEFGIRVPPETLRRFWQMLAHYHGQVWNASDFARSFGVSNKAVSHYVDLMTSLFMVKRLRPWHANIRKRQVKSPKIYLSDSGLLHALLGLEDFPALEGHPKVGASWEGFCLETIMQHLGARAENCYFWSTHAGAELDLLVVRGKRRMGFEVKRTTAPKVTPSMRASLEDLELSSLDVVHLGDDTFPLAEGIRAVSFHRLLEDVFPLG